MTNPKNQFGPQSKNLASIIRGFKIGVTKNARHIHPNFEWQPRFHDHIIRDQKSFQNISNYIINNPKNWNNDKINESTPKTLLYMKMSEKFKIEKEGEGAISRLGSECPGDIQAIEPRSGWVARRRSHSYVEERFYPMTKILDFAAICNKKRFSEWTHKYINPNYHAIKTIKRINLQTMYPN